MRKNEIRKAHSNLRKTELALIIAAFFMIALTLVLFLRKPGAGVPLKSEIIAAEGLTKAAGNSGYTKKVNINTASPEELITLPEIGEVLAGRIVKYRSSKGGFKKAQEIMNVSGIGEKTFEKIKDMITVD